MTTSQCSEKINFISSLNWTNACGHMQIKGSSWFPITTMAAASLSPQWKSFSPSQNFHKTRAQLFHTFSSSPGIWHQTMRHLLGGTKYLSWPSPALGRVEQTGLPWQVPWMPYASLLEFSIQFYPAIRVFSQCFTNWRNSFSPAFLPESLFTRSSWWSLVPPEIPEFLE